MNHLIHESSPYLLQHAHNPVEWFAWKEEAFEKAVKEDKPILVSIGYSTCHWCHVMERESFEDPEIAEFMNKNFVNIKVDREERPDVDQIYMEAVQYLSGGAGGWPLNCFLTPDKRPFYGGTYFPPQPYHNRPSWLQVLKHMVHTFRTKRTVVEKQADRLMELLENGDERFTDAAITVENAGAKFNEALANEIFGRMNGHFDREHGGFGGAPKFPGTMGLDYLLMYAYYTKEEEALNHVHFSLEKMIRGGIYDQIGGGFARYATDNAWLIPHFEKMLYDNALLVKLLSDVYQHSPKKLFKDAIEETLEFIEREMTSKEGGFYSALDADSEGEEGKFYVWNADEIRKVLGEEADLLMKFYGVSDEGNWEGKNILWRPKSVETFTSEHALQPEDWARQLNRYKKKLLEKRSERVRPGLDDKIILGWNALMTTAYITAYKALGTEDYKEKARKNIHFVLNKMAKPDGFGLFHTYKDGKAQYEAFADDYAFFIEALLAFYQIDFDEHYLKKAVTFTNYVIDQFSDSDSPFFFYANQQQTDLVIRKKELFDNATPSGNSSMAHNLIKLGILMDNDAYRKRGYQMVGAIVESLEKYPSSFSNWATALLSLIYSYAEVAVVGKEAINMADAINQLYIPHKVIMAAAESSDNYPLLTGKTADDQEKATIYLCRDYSCLRPVTTLEAFKQLLK